MHGEITAFAWEGWWAQEDATAPGPTVLPARDATFQVALTEQSAWESRPVGCNRQVPNGCWPRKSTIDTDSPYGACRQQGKGDSQWNQSW